MIESNVRDSEYETHCVGENRLRQPMFEKIWENAPNCTECGDCMERCPYNLPIPDLIKENLHWVNEIKTRGY